MKFDVMTAKRNVPSKTKSKRYPRECQVCHSPAIYSYVGAIVCASCKMFFKRNANKSQNHLKCYRYGRCQIDRLNRHCCACCRMKKCLDVGMKVDLLRNGHAVDKKKSQGIHSQQHRNVLDRAKNRLLLRYDQLYYLRKLKITYGQMNETMSMEIFLQQQCRLPAKMRFRVSSVHEWVFSVYHAVQYFYESNADYCSLSMKDRQILMHRTVPYVMHLNIWLMLFHSSSIGDPRFDQCCRRIYGHQHMQNGFRCVTHLDGDEMFIALVMNMMMFSTMDHRNDPNEGLLLFDDFRLIGKIENENIDLAWRYICHRFGMRRAVRIFSSLVQSWFALHQSLLNH